MCVFYTTYYSVLGDCGTSLIVTAHTHPIYHGGPGTATGVTGPQEVDHAAW